MGTENEYQNDAKCDFETSNGNQKTASDYLHKKYRVRAQCGINSNKSLSNKNHEVSRQDEDIDINGEGKIQKTWTVKA